MHESLRMYIVCKALNWNHLPNNGGIYRQRPKFLDDVVVIMNIEARVEKHKQAIEKRKQGNRRGPSGKGRKGR